VLTQWSVVKPAMYSVQISCSRSKASRSVPMKALFTFLVMTISPGRGVLVAEKAEPGEEGCKGEDGDVERCWTWIIRTGGMRVRNA